MALTKALEELLALITDEGDRTAQRALLEKHEPLRERYEGYLRQSDYDKQMNTLKADREKEKTEIETARANIKKWQDWYEDSKTRHNTVLNDNKRLSESEKTLKQERDRLADQIKTAAAAGGGDDVNLAAVQQAVEERIQNLPYVSKEGVAQIVAEETKKAVAAEREAVQKELISSTLPAWSSVILDYQDVVLAHRNEFNESLDRKALADFMQKEGITDVKKGHDAFVSGKRQEVTKTNMRKEIEDSVRKELMPVPGSGAVPTLKEIGPIAQRVQNDAKARQEAGGGGRVGDGSAARAAAASLIEKGKY